MAVRIHWGIAVAVVYTTFAAGTVGFVAFAMSQDVDLVTPDYYARSLQHDAHMRAVANANAIGEALQVTSDPEAGEVRVRWPAAMAARVRGSVTLYRPSDAHSDRRVPLVVPADGTVSIPTAGLAAGHWRLHLQWRADGRDYHAERDLVLR
jgi:nitrogen fixation protein FixH